MGIMDGRLSRREFLAIGGGSLLLGSASAQQAPDSGGGDPSFKPQQGQAGKDVIWVPTPDRLVTRMLKLAALESSDYVIDLGSGDGKIVIAAAREFGANGLGIEYNPDMVALSQRNAAAAGLAERARFMRADIFASDFSRATVITMYLLPHLNLRLRHTLMAMKPGTRLVSHEFKLGDWEPDETSRLGYQSAHLWIVPANAGGEWSVRVPHAEAPATAALTIDQTFQKIRGNLSFDGLETTLREARVDGTRIRFAFTDLDGALRQVDAQIEPDRIAGTITTVARGSTRASARPAEFVARRVGAAPPINGSQPLSSAEVHGRL
ncbi:MAG: class I SAM-dependent methyltransferase [Burkholderiales bacterium]|nr:MAG: class I SAM-dependent methyltransferase [Burkholderiales bacterium]